MKLFTLHFTKNIRLIWICFFITFICFSCQKGESKKHIASSEHLDINEFLIDPKPLLKFNQNKYLQLFNITKYEIGLSLENMKYKSKDFLTLANLFYANHNIQNIEERHYFNGNTQSDLYSLEYNSNKLIGVFNINESQQEITFKYDKSNKLIEALEKHKYPDLIETNQNKVRNLKGKESVIRTSNIYENDILVSTIYDEIMENEKRNKDIDSFYYFVSKSDPSLQIIKEINITKNDIWFGTLPNFKHYILKDNKLIKCIEYNGDSSIYSVFEFSYLSENSIQIDHYKMDDSKSLVHSFQCSIEIDNAFNIQNITLKRTLSSRNEIFEKQFVYIYNENDLFNIQVSKREYEDESNRPEFEKEREIIRMN